MLTYVCRLSSMGCYGHDYLKPTRVFGLWPLAQLTNSMDYIMPSCCMLYALSPYINSLKRKVTRSVRKRHEKSTKKAKVSIRYVSKDGSWRVKLCKKR